jgi:glutamyl-tRNA synthetase
MSVVTRFAPSPTGFLHIGGGRTALFNWLYARHHGGKMLLRIEDTDRERSTAAAVNAIIDGLTWLGLSWDGEIVFQFPRAARHRQVAEQLLAAGKAYHCYASPEELAEMREAARREGRSKLYDGRWRDRDPAEAPPGVKPVIRLKAPTTGETVIEDQVQGRVVWQNSDLDDLVLLRSDGTPTYMLAVVVDDHDMAVTHVIRGDDHLTNAARQKHIYDALGWNVPVFAHIPLIHGPDGSKLSKRHGALGVDAYRAMGYLPAAMRNYLVRLGWNVPVFAHIPLIHGPDGSKLSKRHGALGVDAYRAMGYLPAAMRNYLVRLGWAHGDQEIFTTEEMVAAFDLAQIGRSPARFDFAKLENLNGHYIRATDDAELLAALEQLLPHIAGGQQLAGMLTPALRAKLIAAMPGLKERAKTLVELFDASRFIWAPRPLEVNEQAKTLLTDEARAAIAALLPELAGVADWNAANIEAVVRPFAERSGLKLGAVAQPLRAALTGRTTSPPIFDVLAVLGREESLARLRDQIAVRPAA